MNINTEQDYNNTIPNTKNNLMNTNNKINDNNKVSSRKLRYDI